TGAGAPGAPGIIQCLKKEPSIEIHSCDIRSDAAGRFLSHRFHLGPAANNTQFINDILAICLSNNIEVIIPIVTAELFHFAKHISQFEAHGIKVLCNTYEVLKSVNDKGNLYQFLATKGIPVPEFHITKTLDQFTNAVTQLGY